MRKIIMSLFVVLISTSVWAQQSPRELIMSDLSLTAGEYRLYTAPKQKETPAPKGFKPFYILHYGRHGSRFIHKEYKFDNVFSVLLRAKKEDALTEQGRILYDHFESMSRLDAGHRAGDLTQEGQRQHQGIARRMYNQYPEIFRHNPQIRSISTIVPRCILSMNAFTAELLRCNSKLDIWMDTGYPYMYFLNPYYRLNNAELSKYVDCFRYPVGEWMDDWKEFVKANYDPKRLMNSLFKNDFASTIENPYTFVYSLFKNAVCNEGTEYGAGNSIVEIFTPEERYQWWRFVNAVFYHEKGPSGDGDDFLHSIAATLLRHFVDSANKAIKEGKIAVDLEFGHDGCIMGVLGAMRVPSWTETVREMSQIENYWHSYDIPMAANMRFVFYRNSDNEILFKLLLNEKELKLQFESELAPYYRWDEVSKAYEGYIANSIYEKITPQQRIVRKGVIKPEYFKRLNIKSAGF